MNASYLFESTKCRQKKCEVITTVRCRCRAVTLVEDYPVSPWLKIMSYHLP